MLLHLMLSPSWSCMCPLAGSKEEPKSGNQTNSLLLWDVSHRWMRMPHSLAKVQASSGRTLMHAVMVLAAVFSHSVTWPGNAIGSVDIITMFKADQLIFVPGLVTFERIHQGGISSRWTWRQWNIITSFFSVVLIQWGPYERAWF